MESGDNHKKLETARALEAKGKLEFAYTMYHRAGAYREAARILSKMGRHADAAQLLLESAGIELAEVATLDGAKRKEAFLAATYLAKAGENRQAVELLVGLGEYLRAADLLERSGDMVGAHRLRERRGGPVGPVDFSRKQPPVARKAPHILENARTLEQQGRFETAAELYLSLKKLNDAGRCLRRAGRHLEAARAYDEAGQSFAAAICYRDAGEHATALEKFLRVRPTDDSYRNAVANTITIATSLNEMNFRIEHFLSDFIATAPRDDREAELLCRLVELYERHHLTENAEEVVRKVLAKHPGHAVAVGQLERLKALNQPLVGGATNISGAARGRKEPRRAPAGDDRKASPLPSLPELPELNDLPGLDDPDPENLPNITDSPPTVPLAAEAAKAKPSSDEPAIQHKSPTGPFVVGATIADRYLLQANIGSGGMATVFKARDLMLDEDIALKVFRMQSGEDERASEGLERFKQELKLCRRLKHANIVSVYDFGVFQSFRFISMELLQGQSLEDIVKVAQPFDRGLNYLIQVCAGVQAAHDQGVIHRDLKPANLFVTTGDIVKIMDFGIAKNLTSTGMTATGLMAGTPEFMSPEQISQFSRVTTVSDLYNIGLVAYQLFTSQVPFTHKELVPLLMMQSQQEPRPPRELRLDMPVELEKVILRLLEKEPEKRHSSCRELAGELQQIRYRLTLPA